MTTKDENNNTSILYKCDKVINGFSNSTSKNSNIISNNNTDSTISNTNTRPGQNTFIPDFIVKNSTLYANGLIDTVAFNKTEKNGNQTSSNSSDNTNSNISNFQQDGIEYQKNSISPVS